MKDVLLIIDVQRALLDELPAARQSELLGTLVPLLDKARSTGLPVVYVRHDGSPGELIPGTPEWQIASEIAPRAGEPIVEKRSSDAFAQTNLTEVLAALDADHLIAAGMQTDVCVNATIAAATERGYRVTLVEATLKKAQFLREVAVALDLPVTVIAERAEIAGRRPDLRDRFASATARAVASAPAVLELTLPFLAPNGMAVLPRGELGDAERRATADAALVLNGELSGEIELDGRRRILLVTKRGPTPSRFPRRAGVPEKRPLCFASAAARRGDVKRDGGRTAPL